jgi:hypothetical protein
MQTASPPPLDFQPPDEASQLAPTMVGASPDEASNQAIRAVLFDEPHSSPPAAAADRLFRT